MLFRGALIGQLSGSLGGITASNNRGGTYFRSRGQVVNPNTEAQQTARARMIAANVAYSALTDAQRTDWKEYAQEVQAVNKLGDNIVLTGQNAYIGMHTSMSEATLTPVVVPPTPNSNPTGVIASVSAVTQSDTSIQMEDLGVANRVLLYVSNPLPAAQSHKPNRKRLFNVEGLTATPDDVNFPELSSVVGARFGIFTKVVNADGSYSPIVYEGIVTVEASA